LYEYSKMVILLFLIILLVYLLPSYPKPVVIENFLTEKERKYIIEQAKNELHVSTVDKDKRVDERIRKSETAWLNTKDPIIRNVVERCVSRTDRPIENCEQLQVLRYTEGGHYKPHQDVFYQDKNKRLYTLIIALNDDYEGGETTFPYLNEKYKLNAGDALFFHTLDNYGLDTSDALHGGQPVKSGEKWVCNLWVHKYAY
jgi:predicted 2-oxoglutarate/Fe(II)-dependent dioxygenase YbiX